jgi:sulfonate transport system substrate-binding protein
MTRLTRRGVGAAALAAGLLPLTRASTAAPPAEIRIDWATYNPVGLLLKDRGWLEEDLARDGIGVRWVQSLGSNKALEFLSASSIDFGSTAGAAALLGRINGNPVRSIYVYSRPEWTALVAPAGSPIAGPADLRGKRIAVTRGTDPHIFLIRALASAGLKERDVKLVLLQHPDGKLALLRGDVDAWAGLDPLMAAAEVENGARLFHRRPELNTWGVLNVRAAFAAEHPALVARVIAAYERARRQALERPGELAASLIAATRLPDAVIAKQLERTDISSGAIGKPQRETILAAGLALQEAGVIAASADVAASVEALIDERFTAGAS